MKPLAALRVFLCLAWLVTPRFTRAMDDLLQNLAEPVWREAFSAVRQEVLLDVVAVGLEQGRRAAQAADLLLRPLDHAMLLAALGIEHLAGAGYLAALLRACLRLQLGHLALLNEPCAGLSPDAARMLAVASKANRHGSPNGR